MARALLSSILLSMPYVIYLGVPFLLLTAFIALVVVEEKRGKRLLLPGRRYNLDLKASRAAFVIRHVDWGAFLNDIVRTSVERLAHDIAHTTLMAVRAAERQLTGFVRTLRARRDEPLLPQRSPDAPSRLEQAASHVKKTVRRARKVPVVSEEDGK